MESLRAFCKFLSTLLERVSSNKMLGPCKQLIGQTETWQSYTQELDWKKICKKLGIYQRKRMELQAEVNFKKKGGID